MEGCETPQWRWVVVREIHKSQLTQPVRIRFRLIVTRTKVNTNALEIGIQETGPVNLVAIGIHKGNRWKKVVIVGRVHVHCQNLLMRAAQAGGLFPLFLGFGERRQEQSREDPNDRDDNQ